jgi:NAD(P)-dependent dehydrogenase (short-subunit alcohol dehydrogenase family)
MARSYAPTPKPTIVKRTLSPHALPRYATNNIITRSKVMGIQEGGLLAGKVILITGGGNGIGRECALQAALAGAKIVVNDLGGSVAGGDEGSVGPAQAVVDEIKAAGGDAVANSQSVTDMAAVKGMIEQAKDVYGGLHAIINPAGILRDGMFHKLSDPDWDAVIDVHLRGAYNALMFCLPPPVGLLAI